MLYWSVLFAILTVLAALLGYGGNTPTLSGVARIGFWVFLTTFLISIIMTLAGRRRMP